jgi:hypothetical protein
MLTDAQRAAPHMLLPGSCQPVQYPRATDVEAATSALFMQPKIDAPVAESKRWTRARHRSADETTAPRRKQSFENETLGCE